MFKFNKETARSADPTSGRIEQSGSYDVTIKQAYVTKSASSESEAMTLEIESGTGDTGKLFFWYQKRDGSSNDMAIAAIQAIMGCLKIREMDVSQGIIDAFDFDKREMTKKKAMVFEAFVGKKLKMAIQAKWDSNNAKGIPRIQLEMRCPANMEGFTISEILDGSTKPEMFVRAVNKLRPLPEQPPQVDAPGIPDHPAHNPTMGSAAMMDDDQIPF